MTNSENEIFNYEAPVRSTGMTKRVLIILCAVVVVVGIGFFLFKSRDDRVMEKMGAKFQAKLRKALDDNDLSSAQKVLWASWVFGRETEYVKGKTREESKNVLGPWPMTFDEFRSEVEKSLMKPNMPLGTLDEKSYSSTLSTVLAQDEITLLAAMRKRHAYWQELREALKSASDSRYKWKTLDDGPVDLPANGIVVKEDLKGNPEIVRASDGAGAVAFYGNKVLIDRPGSSDIRIEIDPAVRRTSYAGLIFTVPCTVEILRDTTVVASQEGIEVKDKNGNKWVSRKALLNDKEIIAFFPL